VECGAALSGTRKEPIGVVTGTSYNIHTAHTAELYHPAVTHTQATCRRTATRRSAIAEKAPCTGNRIRVSVRPELRPRIRYGPKLPPLDSNPTSTLSLLSYPHLIIVNELVPFDGQGHGDTLEPCTNEIFRFLTAGCHRPAQVVLYNGRKTVVVLIVV